MKAEHERMSLENDDPQVTFLKKELKASLVKNESLEKENQELRQEVARLKAQVSSLKAHDNERKSMLWKKIQNSIDNSNSDASQQKVSALVKMSEQCLEVENLPSKQEFTEFSPSKERPAIVPKPPPRPTLTTSPSIKEVKGVKVLMAPTPPPPPPPPSKSLVGMRAVRRVPEVVELYRSLTRRDAQMENRTNPIGIPVVSFSRNMIGEIENRSTHLSAIKSDVEKQGEFINFLIKEVESAAYRDISDVEAFVKWLDKELSYLVDERAVLKHFPQWPEKKADALREAAFSYRDLRNLESEVSSFQDNPKEPLMHALRRMQTLQDRLERSINNTERTRESVRKRYRDFQIPWEWMLDTGLIGQMKLSPLRLAREYMKRITKELLSNDCSREENLKLQAVRFVYRIHQFAGGFDAETIRAFEELKKLCTDNHKQ